MKAGYGVVAVDPRFFGNWRTAISEAGLDYQEVSKHESWSRERIAAEIRRLHQAGNRIVIHTARGSETGRDWTADTREQLQRWGVRHDRLCFGKPAADFYVDDRALPLATLLAWIGSCSEQDRRELV